MDSNAWMVSTLPSCWLRICHANRKMAKHVLSEIPRNLPYLFSSMSSPVIEECSGLDFAKYFLDIMSF